MVAATPITQQPVAVPISMGHLTDEDRAIRRNYLDQAQSTNPFETDKSSLLANLPLTPQPSLLPLTLLSSLLTQSPGDWPVFDLVRSYTRAWKHLPEDAKTGHDEQSCLLVRHVDEQVRSEYPSLGALLPSSQRPAIIDGTDVTSRLSHANLAAFVRNFRLPIPTTSFVEAATSKPVVAIALANGPLLGLALLAVTNFFTAAPMSTSSGPVQFRADVEQSRASVIMVTQQDVGRLGLTDEWVSRARICIVIVNPESGLTFSMSLLENENVLGASDHKVFPPNKPADIALLLFTSGTSGKKKSVPITVHTIVTGVAFVIESWGLKADDSCLNMMPLFHV